MARQFVNVFSILYLSSLPLYGQSNPHFNKFISQLTIKELPFQANTNFDNFAFKDELNHKEQELLQVKKIKPSIDKVFCNEKISLSSDFITLYVSVKENEQELRSYLVTYSKNGDMIDHIEVAYDEIAEGMLQTRSEVKLHIIKVIETVSFGTSTEKIKRYELSENGEFLRI